MTTPPTKQEPKTTKTTLGMSSPAGRAVRGLKPPSVIVRRSSKLSTDNSSTSSTPVRSPGTAAAAALKAAAERSISTHHELDDDDRQVLSASTSSMTQHTMTDDEIDAFYAKLDQEVIREQETPSPALPPWKSSSSNQLNSNNPSPKKLPSVIGSTGSLALLHTPKMSLSQAVLPQNMTTTTSAHTPVTPIVKSPSLPLVWRIWQVVQPPLPSWTTLSLLFSIFIAVLLQTNPHTLQSFIDHRVRLMDTERGAVSAWTTRMALWTAVQASTLHVHDYGLFSVVHPSPAARTFPLVSAVLDDRNKATFCVHVGALSTWWHVCPQQWILTSIQTATLLSEWAHIEWQWNESLIAAAILIGFYMVQFVLRLITAILGRNTIHVPFPFSAVTSTHLWTLAHSLLAVYLYVESLTAHFSNAVILVGLSGALTASLIKRNAGPLGLILGLAATFATLNASTQSYLAVEWLLYSLFPSEAASQLLSSVEVNTLITLLTRYEPAVTVLCHLALASLLGQVTSLPASLAALVVSAAVYRTL